MVGYLTRAAHRGFLARGTSQGAAGPSQRIRPALASRSPLAEADQRLHLDSFAEGEVSVSHSPMPLAPVPENAPATDHDSTDGSVPGRNPVAGSLLDGAFEPRPVHSSQFETNTDLGPIPIRGAGPAAPAHTQMGEGGIGHIAFETVAATDVTAETPPVGHPQAGTVSSADITIPTHQNQDGTSAPELETGETVNPSTAQPADPQQAAMNSLLTSLTAAERWITGGAHAPHPNEITRADVANTEAATGTGPAPQYHQDLTPMPVRTVPGRTGRGLEPEPVRLEIGKIDVEVVAPVPAPKAAPRRSSQGNSLMTGSSATPPFGWRQR